MSTRGRPPSAKTIEKRRIENMLQNAPAFRPLTDMEKAEWKEAAAHNEKIRLEILKDYKGSDPTIPDDHAYEMASLGDESLSNLEHLVISRDAAYRVRSKQTKAAGAAATNKKSADDASKICTKNQDLLSSIQPAGRLTVNGIAKRIWADWDTRGYGERVTVRTLSTYIRIYLKK